MPAKRRDGELSLAALAALPAAGKAGGAGGSCHNHRPGGGKGQQAGRGSRVYSPLSQLNRHRSHVGKLLVLLYFGPNQWNAIVPLIVALSSDPD